MIRWVVLGIVLLAPTLVLGSMVFGDTFTARVFVGEDTVAPTTPVILSAVPVSPYQIDVTWSAVTDDVFVSGYRIYRDSVIIATTTQTSFSDIGLTASTTYTYEIDAFDFLYNVSSTSLPVATTTLALPPVVPPVVPATTTPSAPESTAVPTAHAIEVVPSKTSASVRIDTFGPTTYVLRWGRTTSYELGSMVGGVLRRNHTMTIESLEPGTRYFYQIELINNFGVKTEAATASFVTAAEPVPQFLMNVSDASATVVDTSVRLSWIPPDISYQTIRVVRSHLFYPLSPQDGVVIYEGTGSTFVDTDALRDRTPYYYAIFVVYPNGQVSSGVALRADRVPFYVEDSSTDDQVSTPSPTVPVPLPAEVDIGEEYILRVSDVYLEQGEYRGNLGEPVRFVTSERVVVYVPKTAVPPHLKALLLSVANPSNHRDVTVYLLKLSPDGMRYQTEFFASKNEGEALLLLEVYDFQNASIRTVGRRVLYQSAIGRDGFMTRTEDFLIPVTFSTTVFIGGALLFGFFWWRRREDNP